MKHFVEIASNEEQTCRSVKKNQTALQLVNNCKVICIDLIYSDIDKKLNYVELAFFNKWYSSVRIDYIDLYTKPPQTVFDACSLVYLL